MQNVYLLLGSNLGESILFLEEAVKQIEQEIGVIKKSSNIYESSAWGLLEQPNFVNQVIEIETDFAPEELLIKIHEIETKMGRIRIEKWGARLIDIDILFYSNQVMVSDFLTIPHKHIAERRFTLVPLVEIAKNWIHPIFKKSMQELLEACMDNGFVREIKNDKGI